VHKPKTHGETWSPTREQKHPPLYFKHIMKHGARTENRSVKTDFILTKTVEVAPSSSIFKSFLGKLKLIPTLGCTTGTAVPWYSTRFSALASSTPRGSDVAGLEPWGWTFHACFKRCLTLFVLFLELLVDPPTPRICVFQMRVLLLELLVARADCDDLLERVPVGFRV
jgi:hypothetical protein